MTKNAYIHIPFCKGGKCNYCSFVSYPDLNFKNEYVEALVSQINAEYKGEALNTLYFGGGTPSALEVSDFKKIIKLFNYEKSAEITVEINPENITQDYLIGLKELGVNRISFGAQTFNDEMLKIIGRRHTSETVERVVDMLGRYEYPNVSLDLIYGLPGQSIEDFENDLRKSISLGVNHISLYGLKIEEGCYFYKNMPKNLPDSDEQADMYLKAVEILSNSGFEHYEISNFARKGFESRHNLNYWDNKTYYGFGCSASGYVDSIRYTNEPELEDYISNPLKKVSKDLLDEQSILEEAVFLGFRKIAGINIDEINAKFKIDFDKEYSKILEKYSDYFVKTTVGYALNTQGLLISNEILAEFIN